MTFGLGVLRLASKDFWNMTPRELHAASEAVRGPARLAMSRDMLSGLMRMYPDKKISAKEDVHG